MLADEHHALRVRGTDALSTVTAGLREDDVRHESHRGDER
jgi:hypothetical protein